jgi:oligopeptide transport system ATP-binding protein
LGDKPVILEVKDLRTEFDSKDGVVRAVNGVSFKLHKGETLGVVGESGCGKSVSMLSIIRLLPIPPARIAAGSIRFLDRDLLKISNAEMQNLRGSKIAMVFQDPLSSLNPVLTIGYQLSEPIRLHLGSSPKEATDRAVEMLTLVGIPEARSRLGDFPHQFSGGMRQRVMIAMALSCNPPLLIADEPTTALDVTIQAQILDVVKRLREQFNMSLIWITHDLAIVAGLADRVIVMYSGFIVEEAPVKELFANPRHPYTRALLRSLPNITGSAGEMLETIEGLPPNLVKLPKGCPFAPRCTYTLDLCREQNPDLEEISPGHKIACWVDVDTGGLR